MPKKIPPVRQSRMVIISTEFSITKLRAKVQPAMRTNDKIPRDQFIMSYVLMKIEIATTFDVSILENKNTVF